MLRLSFDAAAGPNALVASGMHAHVIQAIDAYVGTPTVVARGLAAMAEVSQQGDTAWLCTGM